MRVGLKPAVSNQRTLNTKNEMIKYTYVRETNSTNAFVQTEQKFWQKPYLYVVYTDFQTAGRGQTGNKWESERAKNLLFSILLRPENVAVSESFYISQLISVALFRVLSQYGDAFSIKWPNDIYYTDKKIAGILIENTIKGNMLGSSIVGVGLNVNQKHFSAYPLNPISLCNISSRSFPRKSLLKAIVEKFAELYQLNDRAYVQALYFEHLYRREGWHKYIAENETIEARIADILPDGQLLLEKRNGSFAQFYFKEVSFAR